MHRHAGLRIRLGVLALFVSLAGCSSAEPAPTARSGPGPSSSGGERTIAPARVYERGASSVTASVGPGGGTLELASGPRLVIPAGTLEQPQEVVLKEASKTTAFSNQEHQRTEGPTFVVGPALEALPGKPIEISLPLAAYPDGWGDVALGYEFPVQHMAGVDDAEHTKWQYATAKLSDGRAVAQLPAINGYRLQFLLSNLVAQ